MNYIKHLNAVFQRFSKDDRLNPSHISLYSALFQFWNINRFPPVFYINREEVMRMAKVGAKGTYHRSIKNLHDWKYIIYLPSFNPYKGSQVKLLKFGTGTETGIETCAETGLVTGAETGSEQPGEQVTGQAVVSYINNNKHTTNNNKPALAVNKNEVLEFFKKENCPVSEGEKFFNYYASVGWQVRGGSKITDWRASAGNWILRAKEMTPHKTSGDRRDHLKITKNKRYDQPL